MVAASKQPDMFFCLGQSLTVMVESDALVVLVVCDALDFCFVCINLLCIPLCFVFVAGCEIEG